MNNNWIITGFTGAGKTTALNYIESLDQIAKRFESFIDLDQSFSRTYQHPSLYIKEFGFDQFRSEEFNLLKKEVQSRFQQLISVGGGALHEESYLWLRSAGVKILAIDCPFEICWQRIEGDESRPITQLSINETMKLFQARRDYWLNADYLVHNNGERSAFFAELKTWYSCQAAADV